MLKAQRGACGVRFLRSYLPKLCWAVPESFDKLNSPTFHGFFFCPVNRLFFLSTNFFFENSVFGGGGGGYQPQARNRAIPVFSSPVRKTCVSAPLFLCVGSQDHAFGALVFADRERCEQHAKALEQLSCENVVLDCQATRLKEKFQQVQSFALFTTCLRIC